MWGSDCKQHTKGFEDCDKGKTTSQIPGWPLGGKHEWQTQAALQRLLKQSRRWNHNLQKAAQNFYSKSNYIPALKKKINTTDLHKTPNLIIFKISRIWSKITWHMKNQENLNHMGKTVDRWNVEITEMLKLSDKDFKVVTIKMLKEVRVNTLEINKKTESLANKQKI